MIKIERIEIDGWRAAIRGMRNPLNSWEKSDSRFYCLGAEAVIDIFERIQDTEYLGSEDIKIGPNDYDLMKRLAKSGPEHAKYLRMINVTMDITAPLYWWKEFDTYKVGTVVNSCSTMHKIHTKKFTLDDFSYEHLLGKGCITDHDYQNSYDILSLTIEALNFWREIYIGENQDETIKKGDKMAWWQIIQLLPSSYNQKRTVQLNYAVLSNIYRQRKEHKLDEWQTFCHRIEDLPYSELITLSFEEGD